MRGRIAGSLRDARKGKWFDRIRKAPPLLSS
jgi:hypothetical protein